MEATAFAALAAQVAELASLIKGKDIVAAPAGPPLQAAITGADGSGPSYAQVASEDGALEAAIAASLLPAYSGQQPEGRAPAEPTIAEQIIAEMAVKAAEVKALKAARSVKAAEAKAAIKLELEAEAAASAAAELAKRIPLEEAEDVKVVAALQAQMDELAARSVKRKAATAGEGAQATTASRKKAAHETMVQDQAIAANVETQGIRQQRQFPERKVPGRPLRPLRGVHGNHEGVGRC